MHRQLSINLVEHDGAVHAYIWRHETLGRHSKRRQVAVLWLPGASTFASPVELVEALLCQLRQPILERPYPPT